MRGDVSQKRYICDNGREDSSEDCKIRKLKKSNKNITINFANDWSNIIGWPILV